MRSFHTLMKCCLLKSANARHGVDNHIRPIQTVVFIWVLADISPKYIPNRKTYPKADLQHMISLAPYVLANTHRIENLRKGQTCTILSRLRICPCLKCSALEPIGLPTTYQSLLFVAGTHFWKLYPLFILLWRLSMSRVFMPNRANHVHSISLSTASASYTI